MIDGRYLVVRQNDAWFIKFEDEENGPYRSETEAMGFAVEAARKLSASGEHPEVCVISESGRQAWAYEQVRK